MPEMWHLVLESLEDGVVSGREFRSSVSRAKCLEWMNTQAIHLSRMGGLKWVQVSEVRIDLLRAGATVRRYCVGACRAAGEPECQGECL